MTLPGLESFSFTHDGATGTVARRRLVSVAFPFASPRARRIGVKA